MPNTRYTKNSCAAVLRKIGSPQVTLEPLMSAIDPSMPFDGEFRGIVDRLDSAGNQYRMALIIGAVGRFLAMVIPVVTGIILLAGALPLPHWLRWTGLSLIPLVVAVAYWKFLHELLWQRPAYAQIARWLEQRAVECKLPLDNSLINAVLLARELDELGDQQSLGALADPRAHWIPQVLREIHAGLQSKNLSSVVPWKQQTRPWLLAAVFVLAALALTILFPNTMAHGLGVLSAPGRFVPRQGTAQILSILPGNETVLAGQSVSFMVNVHVPHNRLARAKIHLRFKSGKTETAGMIVFGQNNSSYRYVLPSVAENMTYMISVNGTESNYYHLSVLPRIDLSSMAISITPPAYTQLQPHTVVLTGAAVQAGADQAAAPLGSGIKISMTISHAMVGATAILEQGHGHTISMTSTDGRHFSAAFTLSATTPFAIILDDANGGALQQFPANGVAGTSAGDHSRFVITAIPDNPPVVHDLIPHRNLSIPPGNTVALLGEGLDDYGLTSIHLQVAAGKNAPLTTIRRWPIGNAENGRPATQAKVKFALALPAATYPAGTLVRYRFTATDNRNLDLGSQQLGPQTTRGQVYSIRITRGTLAAGHHSGLWVRLEGRLQRMLALQRGWRDRANVLFKPVELPTAHILAQHVYIGQKSLLTYMHSTTRHFPFTPQMEMIRQALDVLSHGDARTAMTRAQNITTVSSVGGMPLLVRSLHHHQANVITALKALLALASNHSTQVASLVSHQGSSFPNTGRQAWKNLALELKKLEKQQRDVLNMSERLAAKPVTQYDAADKHNLKNVAALEDKWSKCLNQSLVNISNLTEQDSANASLLDDLAGLKIALAMSKNALKIKAIKIATPLEQEGLEDAKKLSSNIEKWLLQQPDTYKWEMEEPVAQNDVPNPPLPAKLQDMIGKLLEHEEDLTHSMESLGSKWNDSMNKGLGWGAMDGPISDMSAQGVTGNQMPKNDEIQGRSGSGREGRSSGEMVGATATNKGGRRTPTRLTHDPFQSGRIKDSSHQPPGGATGGGKKSGWGGTGLEGPAPLAEQKDIKRMAGLQAAMLNQTDRLKLEMRAAGFNNFKLIEAAVLMQNANQALHAFHYHTAMIYARMATRNLAAAKVLTGAQARLVVEHSPEIAKKQRKLADTMIGRVPKGYADPVRAYFTKLSTAGQ